MLANLPFTLPPWLPGWAFLLLLLPILLWVLAFILMPFSVFGVKSRLEALESEVDAMHEELKMMAMRAAGVLPATSKDFDAYDEVPNFARLKTSQRGFSEPAEPPPPPAPKAKPFIPPEPAIRERLAPAPQNPPPRPPRRTEPRLD